MNKKQEDFHRPSSRLDRFSTRDVPTEPREASIAGSRVSETEEHRKSRQKENTIRTTVRIPAELKAQCLDLAAMKQVTFTDLVISGLKNQIRRNAEMMNKFTKYHINEDEPLDEI